MQRISFLLFLLTFIGCTDTMSIGRDFDGSLGDAARPRIQSDSCGNGIDDDQNGRIDDGCPCGAGETQACFDGLHAQRRTGMCADGIQTCVANGVEWGDWSNAPCVGSTLPQTEQCTGRDADCDGAIDEGCPCVAGEMRDCGVEFLEGECRGGRQTCDDTGRWSSCLNAVSPRAEVCSNGLDEDCDGDIDEFCGCVPTVEICRDDVDNDCDGETDEPACTPDWMGDGGVGPVMCSSTVCYGAETSFREALRVTYGPHLVTATWEDELVVAYPDRYGSGDGASGDGFLHLLRLDANGTVTSPEVTVGPEPLVTGRDAIDPDGEGISSLVISGSDVIMQYEVDRNPSPTEREHHIFIGRFDFAGNALSTPVEIGTRTNGVGHFPGAMVAQGDRVFVAHVAERDTRVVFGEYVPSSNSYVERFALPGEEITRPEWSMSSSGTTVAVVTEENRNDVPGIATQRRSFVTFVRNGSVIATQIIDGGPAVPYVGGSWQKDGQAVIAWGGDRFLACWARLESHHLGDAVHSVQCRAFSELGAPLTTVFEIAPPVSEVTPRDHVISLAAHGSACSKFFLTNSEYRLIEIDARAGTATMAVRRTPLDTTDGTSWTRATRTATSGVFELRTSTASGPGFQNRVWIASLPEIACF